jgi:hypothetical protein
VTRRASHNLSAVRRRRGDKRRRCGVFGLGGWDPRGWAHTTLRLRWERRGDDERQEWRYEGPNRQGEAHTTLREGRRRRGDERRQCAHGRPRRPGSARRGSHNLTDGRRRRGDDERREWSHEGQNRRVRLTQPYGVGGDGAAMNGDGGAWSASEAGIRAARLTQPYGEAVNGGNIVAKGRISRSRLTQPYVEGGDDAPGRPLERLGAGRATHDLTSSCPPPPSWSSPRDRRQRPRSTRPTSRNLTSPPSPGGCAAGAAAPRCASG